MTEDQKPDLSKIDTSGFLNRALDATPRWALGNIGAAAWRGAMARLR